MSTQRSHHIVTQLRGGRAATRRTPSSRAEGARDLVRDLPALSAAPRSDQASGSAWADRGARLPAAGLATTSRPSRSQAHSSRLPRRWPGGIEPGIAATLLAALSLFSMLCYGVASAITTQNGYAAMRLRREIEDLRAQEALFRYQINLAQSKQRVIDSAGRLGLHPADPVQEVDYVTLPSPSSQSATRLALGRPAVPVSAGGVAGDTGPDPRGLRGLLAGVAEQVVGRAGGQAEASVNQGHRP